MTLRILDLFCGAGGAGMGYARAGFTVVGVDNANMNYYPFDFYRGEWDVIGSQLLESEHFDAIHASPPCQKYSKATRGNGVDYPDLVAPVRDWLKSTGLPYIMENVALAPLENPTMLCGSMFDLGVEFFGTWYQLQRHRFFESNVPLMRGPACVHTTPAVSVFGKPGGTNRSRGTVMPGAQEWAEAMGIDWMSSREITQAIPPVYSEFLGNQLRKRIENAPR